MPIPQLKPTTSIRKTPELQGIFKSSENRHLTGEELQEFMRLFPQHMDRVTAAREVAAVEQQIVEEVCTELFALYPFEQQIPHARAKAIRDMKSVIAYGTLSMVMNDPHWFRDKLLLWMKTILQSGNYPDRVTAQKKVVFGGQHSTGLEKLPVNRRSVFEAYNKIKSKFQDRLTPDSFALMEPYLQQATDTLTAD